MPSDALPLRLIDVLADPAQEFHSAVAVAVEQVRAPVFAHLEEGNGELPDSAPELGRFAATHVDTERFAALIDRPEPIDPETAPWIEKAFRVLSDVSSGGDALFEVRVEPGASLHGAVASKLEDVGRAFGAARVVEAVKAGAFEEDAFAPLLDGLPFRRWNQAERRLAPPLVVDVDGSDFYPAGLAEFLDGGVKIALNVSGPCPPAALVRLVTSGVFVAQVGDASDLAPLAAVDGPGIGAVVPAGAARFVHDPSAGASLGERLRINEVPDAALVRQPISGISAKQQAEELAWLATLADAGAAEAAAPETSGDDPAGKLAAWLLSQAALSGEA